MKVIHFAETLKGGPATHLAELLPYQAQKYDVTVLVPEREAKQISCGGVRIKVFQNTLRTLGGVWSLRSALVKELRDAEYDIIHLHSTFAGLVGRTVPKRKGQRIIYCSRGWAFSMDVHPVKKLAYAVVERVLAARTDHIINISRDEHNRARSFGFSEAKMKLIYNGIGDLEWEMFQPDRKMRRLLFVGRYDRQKGLDILLRAMGDLGGEGYTLSTVGGPVLGDDNIAIPRTVNDLGWQSREEINERMRQCDIVVMPSRWEGFGFVGAEAQRAGRPVVACAVGGLREIVRDGITGALCEPNSPEALASAIRRVAEMSPPEVSVACRRNYEENFTAARMASEIDELYSGVSKLEFAAVKVQAAEQY